MTRRYLAVLHRDGPGGTVGVTVPDLPGCFSAGDDPADALDQAAEAAALWIEDAIASGEPVPAPSVCIEADGGQVGIVEADVEAPRAGAAADRRSAVGG